MYAGVMKEAYFRNNSWGLTGHQLMRSDGEAKSTRLEAISGMKYIRDKMSQIAVSEIKDLCFRVVYCTMVARSTIFGPPRKLRFRLFTSSVINQ